MSADVLFLIAALPLGYLAGMSDLKTMTIPNWISIAMIVAFVVIGLITLPWDSVLWRLGAAAIVLVFGFFLNAFGQLGGGDAKYLAAITPYVSYEDVSSFLFIFAISLLVTLALHRIAMRIKPIRRATEGWASWTAGRNFPMGVSIAVAIVTYLGFKAMVVG